MERRRHARRTPVPALRRLQLGARRALGGPRQETCAVAAAHSRAERAMESTRPSRSTVSFSASRFMPRHAERSSRCRLGVLQAPPDATGAVRFTPDLKDKQTRPRGPRLRPCSQGRTAIPLGFLGGAGRRQVPRRRLLSGTGPDLSNLLDGPARARAGVGRMDGRTQGGATRPAPGCGNRADGLG